jgi:hypothetical protein
MLPDTPGLKGRPTTRGAVWALLAADMGGYLRRTGWTGQSPRRRLPRHAPPLVENPSHKRVRVIAARPDAMMATGASMAARWQVIPDNEGLTLLVELWNGHAITLTTWADDRIVTLWNGNKGHNFADDTLASFRRWLDQAQGRGQ